MLGVSIRACSVLWLRLDEVQHMIIRIFRTTIHTKMRTDFERDFESISVEAVANNRGLISCQIGKPTQWNPDEYAMITYWEDEAALNSFAGEEWFKAVIPPGMTEYPVSFSVEHFYVTEVPS